MTAPILNPDLILVDWYSLPVILVGLVTGALGVVVAFRERGSRIGLRYLALAGSVGLYVFAAGVSYTMQSAEAALFWDRIAHVGVVFIPYTLLAASHAVLGVGREFRRLRHVVLVGSSVSLVLVLATDLFITGTRRLFWAYYPAYGPAGLAFTLFFIVVMIGTLVMHVHERRRTSDPIHRTRVSWLMAALLLGVVGAVDYLPTIGIEIYAFGFLGISAYVVLTGIVIVRFRLVDITPALAAPAILEAMKGALIVTDRNGVIRVANRPAQLWLGLRSERLIDRPLAEVLAGRSRRTDHGESLVTELAPGQYEWRASDEHTRIVEVAASPLTLPGGREAGTVYAIYDVTAHKHAQDELARLALHDTMTGLANRTLLYERIGYHIQQYARGRKPFAVFFIDLDRFKEVNDTLGHEAGDAVLCTVAQRLMSLVRASDTVARVGGDEFVVVTAELTAATDSRCVAEKLAAAIKEPVAAADGIAHVDSSIGIACYPGDGGEAEKLIANADAAMYRGKRTGSGSIHAWSDVADEGAG